MVVFSPQIIENFRRGSADGLSLLFIVVWLAGDVFNILGAVLQGVLPTMIILAVYYTLADIVLLWQCLHYRGIWFSGKKTLKDGQNRTLEEGDAEEEASTERTALLNQENGNGNGHTQQPQRTIHVDGTHLSPATPFIDAPLPIEDETMPNVRRSSNSNLQAALLNTFVIILVCAAGILGWYVSARVSNKHPNNDNNDNPESPSSEPLTFDFWGQVFGYFCAVLYLGSRIPQLLLNYQRKSTEGVSLLFFLFACIGNLTYVLSIFAYSPVCRSHVCEPGEASAVYGRYILVNLSWLIGSLGTLLLDMGIFAQFFLYQKDDDDY